METNIQKKRQKKKNKPRMQNLSEELFTRRFFAIDLYMEKSKTLKSSAEILYKQKSSKLKSSGYALNSSIQLLYGFALEVLFKAILIKGGKASCLEKIKTHDLYDKLLKNLLEIESLNIKLNETEEFIIWRLQISIEWQGRYVIPSNRKKFFGYKDNKLIMHGIKYNQYSILKNLYRKFFVILSKMQFGNEKLKALDDLWREYDKKYNSLKSLEIEEYKKAGLFDLETKIQKLSNELYVLG